MTAVTFGLTVDVCTAIGTTPCFAAADPHRLKTLAPKVTKCCAIIFDNVRVRNQTKEGPESVALKSFIIHHKNCTNLTGLSRLAGPNPIKIAPSETAIIEFFFQHANTLRCYRLDPNCPAVVFAPISDPDLNISISQLKKMSEKTWNSSIVTPTYSRTDVVNIPTANLGKNPSKASTTASTDNVVKQSLTLLPPHPSW